MRVNKLLEPTRNGGPLQAATSFLGFRVLL